MADKAYDAEEHFLGRLEKAGIQAVILRKSNRIIQRDYNEDLYKIKHLLENFLAKPK